MRLHLFTICTGVYNNYITYLLRSLNNIYKGIEKTFNIISDKEYHINLDRYNEYIESNYYHIANLPYPFIAYFKTQYVCDMIKLHNFSEDDYFIFCDIDTFFNNINNDYYKMLFDDDKLHFSKSPWNNIDDLDMCKTENDLNSLSISYINNGDKYIFPDYSQTSLFFGKISKLIEMNNVIMNMVSKDSYNKIIPSIYDQSIINKYIYDNPNKVVCDNYIINAYVDINKYIINDSVDLDLIYNDLIINKDEFYNKPFVYSYDYKNKCLCVQKFNQEIKLNKRNSDRFDNEV